MDSNYIDNNYYFDPVLVIASLRLLFSPLPVNLFFLLPFLIALSSSFLFLALGGDDDNQQKQPRDDNV